MIYLDFDTCLVIKEQYGYVPLKIVRLLAKIQYINIDGSKSKVYKPIVDTGAHTSILSARIWQNIKFEIKTENAWLSGINDHEECRIEAMIANVEGILSDDIGNCTKPLKFLAFLAKTDRVPLLIGVAGILEKYHLYWDYQNNITYLQKKKKKRLKID